MAKTTKSKTTRASKAKATKPERSSKKATRPQRTAKPSRRVKPAIDLAVVKQMLDDLTRTGEMDYEKLKELPDVPETTKLRQAAFLAAYAQIGNVAPAAEIVGISRRTPYRWLGEDEEFKPMFDLARQEFGYAVEGAMHQRALHGTEEFVLYKGEPVTDPDTGLPMKLRKFNVNREMAVLKAAFPDRYKDRAVVENTHTYRKDQLLTEIDEMLGVPASGSGGEGGGE